MNTTYIGMDLHKSTSSFCVMNHEGEVEKEKTIRTDGDEIKKFIVNLGKREKIKLVMEPLSQWYYYADFIEALGVEVRLAHPLKVKAISQSKVKTDKIDAKVLADLLRCNLLPEAYYAPKEVRNWKEICRGRESLVGIKIQVKNKIHAILFRNGLTYSKTTLFTKKGLEWINTLELNPYFKFNLQANLNTLKSLEEEIKTLEKEIRRIVASNEDMTLLNTIPGISDITSIMIMSEIGDISRFGNEKKLQSFAGLVPTVRNSGGRVNHGSISKQGSIYLRKCVVSVANHQKMLKREVGLKWYYQRLVLAHKNTKTATVATARKLLTVVFKVLSEKRSFEERLPKAYQIISSS